MRKRIWKWIILKEVEHPHSKKGLSLSWGQLISFVGEFVMATPLAITRALSNPGETSN